MQIGIDLGATKIEYVLLDNQNKELTRSRIPTPKNYNETIISIIAIIKDIENKNMTMKMLKRVVSSYHEKLQSGKWGEILEGAYPPLVQ